MQTYAHILAVGVANGTNDRKISEYQITLNAGGSSWARDVEGEEELVEFLTAGLGLNGRVIDMVLARLREDGHATVPEIELNENSASVLGLRHTPIDY